MGSVRQLTGRGTLFLDFRYCGQRCREYMALPDTPANRKRVEKVLAKIETEIAAGAFDYASTFPTSRSAPARARCDARARRPDAGVPGRWPTRAARGEAYRACGPVLLESAEGDRPMSIVWKLDTPLPVRLFREFSVLRGA